MASFFRRAGAAIATFFQSTGDPAAATDKVLVYAKDDGGTAQLFARVEDGTIYQLTPPNTALPDIVPLPDQWAQNQVAASQTNVALSAQVSTNHDNITAIRSGSIVGFATRLDGSVAAGTLTVEITKNGTGTGFTATHDNVTNPTGAVVTASAGTHTYVAGDLIGVQITTTGTYSPTTLNLEVWIEAAETLS